MIFNPDVTILGINIELSVSKTWLGMERDF